jgi:nucleotidyltransferase substrate binding protein (TIGR01987 family)
MAEPRWHLRLGNFLRALSLLEEAVSRHLSAADDDLIKAGLIQRFEICWELGWKLMRDYLHAAGSPVDVPVPINVIRAAFQVGLIADGDAWVAAMKARNQWAHVYDQAVFEQAVRDIAADYLPLLRALGTVMQGERNAGN